MCVYRLFSSVATARIIKRVFQVCFRKPIACDFLAVRDRSVNFLTWDIFSARIYIYVDACMLVVARVLMCARAGIFRE